MQKISSGNFGNLENLKNLKNLGMEHIGARKKIPTARLAFVLSSPHHVHQICIRRPHEPDEPAQRLSLSHIISHYLYYVVVLHLNSYIYCTCGSTRILHGIYLLIDIFLEGNPLMRHAACSLDPAQDPSQAVGHAVA
jgi:hypothetical protein